MTGPVLPGLHTLTLVMLLAGPTAPGWVISTRAVLACLLVAGASIVVAFGIVPQPWLLKVPFIANIGHLHDVFITAAVPLLLILVAAGAAVLLSAGVARAAFVMLLTAIVAWWMVRRAAELAPRNGFEPWAGFLVLALAAMPPGCVSRLRHGRVVPVLATAAAIVVVVLPGGLHAGSGIAPLDALLEQPRLRVPLDADSPAVDAVHRAASEPYRTAGVEFVLFSGSQSLYLMEGLGGPDALVVPRYEELVDAAGIWRSDWLTMVGTRNVARLGPLLDLLNVGVLISAPEMVPPAWTAVEVSGQDRLKVGRRPTAWPRAFFVDSVITYTDPSDLLRLVGIQQSAFAAVQITDGPAMEATRGLAHTPGTGIPARGYTLSTNSTRFTVRATGAGVAVLGETFLPDDFRATLNGRRVDYFRVNHVFKGVMIPSAGEWTVAFEYRPARWGFSWVLAGFGLIGAAGLLLTTRFARRAVATASP